MTFVTFVIPTKGRETLERTLDSLMDLDAGNWNAIVVGDGLNPANHIGPVYDEWMTFFRGPALRSAGLTRNVALDMLRFREAADPSAIGKYIAFVDDDDWISQDYVRKLAEADQHNPDVVVFRMDHPTLGIVPHPHDDTIRHGNVGISYAVRYDPWMREFRFIKEKLQQEGPDGNEDIQLLLRFKQSGAKIHVSPHVTYHVGNPVTVRA